MASRVWSGKPIYLQANTVSSIKLLTHILFAELLTEMRSIPINTADCCSTSNKYTNVQEESTAWLEQQTYEHYHYDGQCPSN
jgi:hypothetical protein